MVSTLALAKDPAAHTLLFQEDWEAPLNSVAGKEPL